MLTTRNDNIMGGSLPSSRFGVGKKKLCLPDSFFLSNSDPESGRIDPNNLKITFFAKIENTSINYDLVNGRRFFW